MKHLIIAIAVIGMTTECIAHACEMTRLSDGQHAFTRKPIRGVNPRLSRGFGVRFHPQLGRRFNHTGIDWTAPIGTKVAAAASGRVTATTKDDTGITITIDHGHGWVTRYLNLGLSAVRETQCVEYGELIGTIGGAKALSHPHLHFELIVDGEFVDPLSAHERLKSLRIDR
ncbi:MAG: M23 family metallopeptidase [Alphaproteobacteria bacterium]|nr:M23 family metallopeptidase [Alphaproteobacteria bacterium]